MRKPFLKWAGNKYKILDYIVPLVGTPHRFVEPFAGTCSVSLNVDAGHYYINDINSDLINLYKEVTNANSDEFIPFCGELFIPENNTKDEYISLRKYFNQSSDALERSRLFVYLNRHCFNGLTRYNSKGGFNVPFGQMKNPSVPADAMMDFRMYFLMRNHSFLSQNFDNSALYSQLEPGDVVYFDPPYVPASNTANFTDYAKEGFSYDQQVQLAKLAESLASRGIRVIISNHDTDVSRELYKNAKIYLLEVSRSISAKGSSRKKAKELIAVYQSENCPEPIDLETIFDDTKGVGQISMKLTTQQVEAKLNDFDWSQLNKPGINKGDRGQDFETALGIKNGSDLTDLIDGELKSFTLGQTIAVTQLQHCLPQIIDETVEFEDSKVYEKLKQTIYVGFDKVGNFLKSKTINEANSPEHYQELAEDYGYIAAKIKEAYRNNQQIHTITGPNELLQVRTKASKTNGSYVPLCYNGVQLKDKGMAFYLRSKFGQEVVL